MQREHNRQVVFAGEDDYRRCLEDVQELGGAFDMRVYAGRLMTNHVHLLLGPGEEVASMGRLMKAVAARATRYRNRLERRFGTLWEGRYKSSPVHSGTHLLACCGSIELNPVRSVKGQGVLAGEVQQRSAGYRLAAIPVRLGMDSLRGAQ